MDKLQPLPESSAQCETPAQRRLWGPPPPPQGWRSFLRFLRPLELFGVFAVALLAGVAFAQAPGAQAAAVDPSMLLAQIFDAVHNGNGWLAAGPALTLVVWLLRTYDSRIPKVGPAIDAFLNQPLVAYMLPVVLSAALGLFGALSQHLPVGPALITALKVAATAAFTFLLMKNGAAQLKGAPPSPPPAGGGGP